MKQIRMLSVAVMGVCVCALMMAAGASAQTFHANKTGSLVGKALNTQEFETGAGLVSCTAAASKGTVTALLTLSQLIETKYTGCTAFGFASVTISTAKYLFSADNGQVTIDGTIKIDVPLGGCSVSVGPQVLKEVKYKNSPAKKITEESAVKGISSVGSGGLCGGANSTGTYTGNNELELTGGEISWS